MKKTIYINNIIKAIIILFFLIFVFFKNKQLFLRIFILGFILLIIFNIITNICNLINKPKIANLFHKLFTIIFIILAIIFLSIWSYISFKNKQYFSLLFIIFFLLFLINIIYKKRFKKKDGFNFIIVIISFLVISIIVIGIISLIIGIKNNYNINKKTKYYNLTTAYYDDYEIYDLNTYRLIYVYKVNDQQYTIKTDYGTSLIPNKKQERIIKYNPSNPEEAIILETNKNKMLIYFGTFFFLGGMVFVLGYLSLLGFFDKIKINIFGLYIGIVFLIIGLGIIYIQFEEISSLITLIKQMKYWLFIPLLFIIIGIWQISKSLLESKHKISHHF